MDAKIDIRKSSQEGTRSPASAGSASPGTESPVSSLPIARHYTRSRALAVLAVWLALAAVFAPLALKFTERIQSTVTGMKGTPPEMVREAIVKNFSSALAFPIALVWDAKGVPPAEAAAAWASGLDSLHGNRLVHDVTDARIMNESWPNADWYVAFVAVNTKTYGEAEKTIPQLRTDLAKLNFPGAQPWVTGGPALFLDLNVASTHALRAGELLALPVTFVILLLVFRSLVAALLPVVVAMLGMICTLGVLSCLASMMPMTFFVPNLVTMIGLGVGIDYSLIYLARFRREKANHLTTQEALLIAHQTAGKTVVVSAVLVMSGFLTLFFIPLEFFTSIALGGVLVVASVAVATLTLLPAMIFLVGPRLEFGGRVLQSMNIFHQASCCTAWWGRAVARRPWSCMTVGVAFLLLLAWPALYLRTASVEVKNLPASAPSRMGYESLEHNLGAGWMMPTIVLVQHPDAAWMNGEGLAREKSLVDKLNELPNTGKIVTVSDQSGTRHAQQNRMALLTSFEDPTQSVILLLSKADPQSLAGRHWLDDVHGVLRQSQVPGGPTYLVGGLPSVTLSADRVIMHALPKVVAVTLCSTFILLLLFMRSLLVAIKAVVLNLLCVAAAYGFQVICFQFGWGHHFFHLTPTEGLNTVVMVICFCALFGLSMDYEVFILSAVRESWLDQHNIRLAVQDGLQRVAGIITSAAVIMISVFLCFAFGDVVEIEQLGVGLSFAVFLDATVIRLLLVPSLLTLMGKWAFWLPGHPFPVADKHRGHHPTVEKAGVA